MSLGLRRCPGCIPSARCAPCELLLQFWSSTEPVREFDIRRPAAAGLVELPVVRKICLVSHQVVAPCPSS